MKSKLINDEGADITTATEEQRSKIKKTGSDQHPQYIYPAGTIFEGPQAVFLVKTGQAEPVDDECRAACGMDDASRAAQQENYFMDLLGIRKPEDRDLFRAKIILGYDNDGKYIPGPNWETFQAEKKKIEGEDEIKP